MTSMKKLIRDSLLATALLMWVATLFGLVGFALDQFDMGHTTGIVCPVVILCVTGGAGITSISRIISYLAERG